VLTAVEEKRDDSQANSSESQPSRSSVPGAGNGVHSHLAELAELRSKLDSAREKEEIWKSLYSKSERERSSLVSQLQVLVTRNVREKMDDKNVRERADDKNEAVVGNADADCREPWTLSLNPEKDKRNGKKRKGNFSFLERLE
jgi:hypothetical protein